MLRIVVYGLAGEGKTTLGYLIEQHLQGLGFGAVLRNDESDVHLLSDTILRRAEMVRQKHEDEIRITTHDVHKPPTKNYQVDKELIPFKLLTVPFWYRDIGSVVVHEPRPHIVPATDQAETYIYWLLHTPMKDCDILPPMYTGFGYTCVEGRHRRCLRFKAEGPPEDSTGDKRLSALLSRVTHGFWKWVTAGMPEPNYKGT